MKLSCNKEIGGYIELEFNEKFNNIQNCIALNSARNCLRYIIRAFNIRELYVPFYTCSVVWQAIRKENCKIKFYHIDNNFMPISDFPNSAFVLYTNYFGICAKQVKKLSEKHKNLIVDNAQAFYMPKYGIASFNSIRKFFGLPDGALLNSDKLLAEEFEQSTSYQRISHLIKKFDKGIKNSYNDFLQNENSLNEENIKLISNLTKTIFNSTDIKNAKQKRLNNFHFLDKYLQSSNNIKITLDEYDVPMVYPYLNYDETLREKLYKNKIIIDTFWSPLPKNTQEGIFQKYLLPLPIDQRYDFDDMKRILNVLKAYNAYN